MKACTMVAVNQVAKFMDYNKIHQIRREFHKVHVKVEIADGGAAAPVGFVILDSNTIVFERIFYGYSQLITDDHFACQQFI